jgi:lysophospholipase L1-like esterase
VRGTDASAGQHRIDMGENLVVPEIGSFVALGDSFTEGMGDPGADGICLRGWADRLAERLAADRPALRYANLAVRSKRLQEVAADQLPRAIAMRPDLVSIFAGGNDLLWVRSDPDALASELDEAVVRLRQAGCQVLVFTGFDPRAFPVLRLIRGKVAAFNMHVRSIAARRGCHLADLWSMSMLTDPRAWAADRVHLTPEGHRRVALLAAEVLGIGVDEDWREPLPARPAGGGGWLAGPASWLTARADDVRWAQEHAAPWLIRRLRGLSAGDGIPPKRPRLSPLLTGPAGTSGQTAAAGHVPLAGPAELARPAELAGLAAVAQAALAAQVTAEAEDIVTEADDIAAEAEGIAADAAEGIAASAAATTAQEAAGEESAGEESAGEEAAGEEAAAQEADGEEAAGAAAAKTADSGEVVRVRIPG